MLQDPELHALVVDDDEKIRRMMVRALAAEGITADLAADGAEALQQFDSGKYDLVVTDLRMPNRNGHALAVDLLNRNNAPSIFVFTGVAEPRLVKDLLVRGVQDVMTKPMDYKVLATKIRSRMEVIAESRSTLSHDDCVIDETSDLEDRSSVEPFVNQEQIESRLIEEMEFIPSRLLVELVNLQPDNDIEVPSQVEDFVLRLSRESPYAQNERRQTERVKMLSPVQCVQYGEQFNQIDRPFHVFLRDFSVTGVGIVSLRPIQEKYMALGWTSSRGKGIRTFAEVSRCRVHKPFYEVGGQFVKDL